MTFTKFAYFGIEISCYAYPEIGIPIRINFKACIDLREQNRGEIAHPHPLKELPFKLLWGKKPVYSQSIIFDRAYAVKLHREHH